MDNHGLKRGDFFDFPYTYRMFLASDVTLFDINTCNTMAYRCIKLNRMARIGKILMPFAMLGRMIFAVSHILIE